MKVMKQTKNIVAGILGGFIIGSTVNYNFSPVENVSCSVCFTPKGDCTNRIIRHINSAKNEILVQSYSFTSPEICESLIKAHKRGVKVSCIFDKSQEYKPIIEELADSGMEVFIDRPPGIAHNKVIIIDSEVVLTGSFNFTKAAQHRNVENSILLNSPKIALEYKQKWYERKNLSDKKYPDQFSKKVNYQ